MEAVSNHKGCPMPAPVPSFDEIRAVVASLPPADTMLKDRVSARLEQLYPQARGWEVTTAAWLAGAQRQESPQIDHPRIGLFVAGHGIARDLPDSGPEGLHRLIAETVANNQRLHLQVEQADSDLKLYELAVDQPAGDSRAGFALEEPHAARAIAYGMMAVESGLDALVLAGLGEGAQIAAAAVSVALFPDAMRLKGYPHWDRIDAAIERHGKQEDPLAVLAAVGGADIAAMLGAILAARLAGTPVVLDGPAAHAAGALAYRLRPDALDHCCFAAADASGPILLSHCLPIGAILPIMGETPQDGVSALQSLRELCRLLE
jgi:nicotinate-nucleotide--dimethylbenzimidazole phosphoribosyltransferase